MKDFVRDKPAASRLGKLQEIYDERSYILCPMTGNRDMHVLIKERAVSDDVLCAYFHAVLLAVLTCAINDDVVVRFSFIFFLSNRLTYGKRCTYR